MVLDQVHTASGTAPGTLKTLNLDNYVFFGGHIRQQGTRHGRSPQVANGFRGCMDSIYLNGQELPFNSKPRSYAHMEESVGVSPGCFLTATEDCASGPCQNGGICSPSPAGGRLRNATTCKPYTCVHFRGSPPGIVFIFLSFDSDNIVRHCRQHPSYGSRAGFGALPVPGLQVLPPRLPHACSAVPAPEQEAPR